MSSRVSQFVSAGLLAGLFLVSACATPGPAPPEPPPPFARVQPPQASSPQESAPQAPPPPPLHVPETGFDVASAAASFTPPNAGSVGGLVGAAGALPPDFYTEEERKTSEPYHALQTVAHAGNAIDVRMEGPKGSRILWEINDPLDGDGWSSAQCDSIRRLLPHIRQTVHVQQTLAHANALSATLTEMLDRTGLGIVQLDGRGRIAAA